MTSLLAAVKTAFERRDAAVLVTVETALGSTPREAGARMLVTAGGTAGTIGGGRLEFDAIDKARAMIAAAEAEATCDVPLGPEIGQCCGGRVGLSFRRIDAAELAAMAEEEERRRARLPAVLVFGAGHTGRALATALAPLPLAVSLVDSRPETFVGLPEGLSTVAAAMPESLVEGAPPGAAYVVMTHDHSLDFLIAAAALARADAAYVGMIGSATKRARFRRQLEAEGRAADAARLTLPIGGSALRDKRPAVIAALAAGEIVTCLLKRHQETLP
ncbi:xanthine dehydrogenase accessory protein XdhC [Jiella sonneratiae]|uniref:Xanthine dehydrogenase accessory protein XdhC n=1 Tax=Jiella sonneratiae TaxID=2816856 RepID=A0ABS3J414_9HYPH|nr:xanthine dehydrogenase accessory protein XdhC [Jiella sonneratiae]MBO0904411.1 xanthine dehydrogenase accessory protein XdhC [Jiella sonneratiae]